MVYGFYLRNKITVDIAMLHIDSMQDTKCGMMWNKNLTEILFLIYAVRC